MSDNKHSAVWDWLRTCPHIGDLFFNASRAEDGNTQLIPSEQLVTEYIDGSSLRYYICELARFQAYSPDPNDAENLLAVLELDKITDWVDEQVALGHLPEFPEGCSVSGIEVLTNDAGYMVAQDMSIAKYALRFRIEYVKNRDGRG